MLILLYFFQLLSQIIQKSFPSFEKLVLERLLLRIK